jgi:ribosomal-protein-alanine N-acetyltransferase
MPVDPIPRVVELDLAIRTDRLVLRPLLEADADAYFPLVSDPELPREMSWSAHRTRDETVEWLRFLEVATNAGAEVVWAIVHDGTPGGVVGLHALTYAMRALRVDRATLGYWIAPALRGRGLMREAARAAVAFGFTQLGLRKIQVGCFDGNVASQRVIEKLGFRFLGVERDFAFRDGRWRDQRAYELTAPEWRGI